VLPSPLILALGGLLLVPLISCEPALDDDDSSPSSGEGSTGEEMGGLGKIFQTKDPRSHKTTKGPEPRPSDDDPYLKDLPSDHGALIRALGRAQSAADAREKLAALGGPVLGSLQDAALLSTDPAVQGWAIEVINISEALGLRGPQLDALHAEALAEARETESKGALSDLKRMHLTVLDGIFPGELLATQNLSFSKFTMGEAQNQPARIRSDRCRAG
jgi:hypothetical protein